MAVLDGCVQAAIAPGINAAAARVLDRLGISLVRVPDAACCGALAHHLGDKARTLAAAQRTLDAARHFGESPGRLDQVVQGACFHCLHC